MSNLFWNIFRNLKIFQNIFLIYNIYILIFWIYFSTLYIFIRRYINLLCTNLCYITLHFRSVLRSHFLVDRQQNGDFILAAKERWRTISFLRSMHNRQRLKIYEYHAYLYILAHGCFIYASVTCQRSPWSREKKTSKHDHAVVELLGHSVKRLGDRKTGHPIE